MMDRRTDPPDFLERLPEAERSPRRLEYPNLRPRLTICDGIDDVLESNAYGAFLPVLFGPIL